LEVEVKKKEKKEGDDRSVFLFLVSLCLGAVLGIARKERGKEGIWGKGGKKRTLFGIIGKGGEKSASLTALLFLWKFFIVFNLGRRKEGGRRKGGGGGGGRK